MKITVSQLRKIIKEEVSKMLLEYEQSIVRRGNELYLVDDDGNEDYLEPVIGSDHEHLRDGEAEPYSTGTGGYGGSYGGGYGRRRY